MGLKWTITVSTYQVKYLGRKLAYLAVLRVKQPPVYVKVLAG